MSCENIWTFCESSWINKDLGLFGQKDPYCNMGVHKGEGHLGQWPPPPPPPGSVQNINSV